MRNVLLKAAVLAAFFGAIAAGAAVFAENVDPQNDMSQYAWGENVGWINAEPSGNAGPGVTVSGAGVRGYMWGENIGWINMSCQNNSTCGTSQYGVLNDGAGLLSGYAWGENVGWISFSCTNTNACGTSNYRVQIDPVTGIWSGYAWGENIGWISFSDTTPVAYKVQTDDGDGIAAASDNCAFDANADQTNTDAAPIVTGGAPVLQNDVTIVNSDGLGDACDADDDNDAVADANEAAGCNASGVLNALLADTDGDRIRDGAECALGTNPASAASKPPGICPGESDNDGLCNALEVSIGSNPADADSDDDGLNDGIEYRGYTSSPTNVNSDGDSCGDITEAASVNQDKVVNALDLLAVAQNFNSTTRPQVDVTKDGIANSLDLVIVAGHFSPNPC